jgi:hypothetical protein
MTKIEELEEEIRRLKMIIHSHEANDIGMRGYIAELEAILKKVAEDGGPLAGEARAVLGRAHR